MINFQNDTGEDSHGYNNMVIMKHGDEDLVEDEASVILNTGSKKKSHISEQREDVIIQESTNEQKVTGDIPMLKNNKNALIRNTKPFSQRLRNGELHIDSNNIHAVANQMILDLYSKLYKIGKKINKTPDEILKPILSDSACTNLFNFKELVNLRVIRLCDMKNIKINK